MSTEQMQTTQASLTSEEAQQLCDNLFATTGELISLLEQETLLLRKAKTNEISPLTVRKDALTATLAHHMAKFKNNANEVRQLAPKQLVNLESQREQFQKSIEANQAALIAMQAVSERLLQTVADKVAAKQGGPSVYGQSGQMTNAGVKRSAAINIDTAL